MPKERKPIVRNTKEKEFSAQSLWDNHIKQNGDTLTIFQTQGEKAKTMCSTVL
jgi:hypothetical protein